MRENYFARTGRLCLVLLLVPLLLLSGCKGTQDSESAPSAGKTYEITPSLREFYNTLGGETLFGPAISEKFTFQEFECQYTAGALFCLNPALSGENRFGLYPLGDGLNLREDPGTAPSDQDARVVNGYAVYEEFIPMYDQLSGVRYAGSPISSVHLNYSQDRVEQFFENVGLYRSFSDPVGTVRLLSYGVAACKERCSYTAALAALVLSPDAGTDNQPFLPQLGKLGGATAFGEALTQPYIASDGAQEQVYTNAVLYSPADKPGTVLLRPLAIELELPRADPGPQVYGNQNGVVFYPVKSGLGYHVPLLFDEFIAAHGGTQFSGDPIDETTQVAEGVYRQCFENYCLDYRPDTAAGQQVSMAPLGKLYLEKLQQKEGSQKPVVLSPDTVSLTVSEQFKRLAPSSTQRIDILVLSKPDQKPMAGIEAELDLSLPDGTHYIHAVDPTLADGTAAVIIPVMKGIPNGSILTYQVCLKAVAVKPVCAMGNYLMWKMP